MRVNRYRKVFCEALYKSCGLRSMKSPLYNSFYAVFKASLGQVLPQVWDGLFP